MWVATVALWQAPRVVHALTEEGIKAHVRRELVKVNDLWRGTRSTHLRPPGPSSQAEQIITDFPRVEPHPERDS